MESPPQYSPALRRVTTGFGMGPGGAGALAATGAPDPPPGTDAVGGRKASPRENLEVARGRETRGAPRFLVRAPHTILIC